ncbi:MAG: DUF3035 domain-containing protein [Alphaproteobacteria bacterium]|nr:DUF3035 domain-containing protein [Alphaproteobacteria bacterium]
MVARKSVGLSLALALVAAGSLSGCGGVKDALGASKYPPDEFAVVSKRALVIPPDYNLRPPGPNQPKPKEADPSEMALLAMFPEAKSQLPSGSPAETQLLNASGGATADADVRSDLSPQGTVVNKGGFTEQLLYDNQMEGGAATTIQREGSGQAAPATPPTKQ